jgi:hypothetical protein
MAIGDHHTGRISSDPEPRISYTGVRQIEAIVVGDDRSDPGCTHLPTRAQSNPNNIRTRGESAGTDWGREGKLRYREASMWTPV